LCERRLARTAEKEAKVAAIQLKSTPSDSKAFERLLEAL
jgi:hypothetical protein